jgi:hypothetical protein
MTHTIKNFEELREYFLEEKHSLMEDLIEDLESLTEFERGAYQGRYRAVDDMISVLRNILKYGAEEQ